MKLFYFGKAIYRSNVYLEILAMDISMNKTTTKDRFLMVLNRTLLNSHRKSRFKMFLNFSNEEELTVSFNSFWFYWAVDRRHRICENLRTFLFLLPFEFERVWTTLTLSGITHFFRRIRSPSPSPPHPPTPPPPPAEPEGARTPMKCLRISAGKLTWLVVGRTFI